MKIGSVNVTLGELAKRVYAYSEYMRANFKPADLSEPGELAGGDSQYDTDHRGAWGAAFVPYGCTMKEAREIARELVSEAREDSDDSV